MRGDTSEQDRFGVGTCAACGAEIDTTVWRPTETTVPDDGKPYIYVFCDETCRERWQP